MPMITFIINLFTSYIGGKLLDSSFLKVFNLLKNQEKVFKKALETTCKEYGIDYKKFELFKYKTLAETKNYFKELLGDRHDNFFDIVLIIFLNNLPEKSRKKVLNEIFGSGYLTLDEIDNTIQKLDLKADNLIKWIENHKKIEEAQNRPFIILKPQDTESLERELVIHEPLLTYVERSEIEEIDLEKDKRIILVGKRGSGKSRSLLEILKKMSEDIIILRSHLFRKESITPLDVQLQDCDNFVIVWDDLQRVKDEVVNTTMHQVEQLSRDMDTQFYFLGATWIQEGYYEFNPKKIDLQELRSIKLIKSCKNHFNIDIENDVAKILLNEGDGTPFYIISFFKTFTKSKIEKEDVERLPEEAIGLWEEHIQRNGIKGENEKALRALVLMKKAIPTAPFKLFEDFYSQIFSGSPSNFEGSVRYLKDLFLIEETEEDIYTMHDVQAEAVEEVFPLKQRHYRNLLKYICSLPKDLQNVMLWNYAMNFFLYEEKDEESSNFLNKYIELNPKSLFAHTALGISLNNLNRYREAEEEYKKAIDIDPNYAVCRFDFGNLLYKQKRYQEASMEFTRAGLLFFEQEKIEETIKAFSSCAELSEYIINDYINYCSLFLLLVILAGENLNKVKYADKSKKLKPFKKRDAIKMIRRLKIKDPDLKSISKLVLKKLKGQDIVKEAKVLENRIEIIEMKILLCFLEDFKL